MTSHYEGHTGQQPPLKRIRQHGAISANHIAQIRPGTINDEARVKRNESCPECGKSLWYYPESPTYSDGFLRSAGPGQVPYNRSGREQEPPSSDG